MHASRTPRWAATVVAVSVMAAGCADQDPVSPVEIGSPAPLAPSHSVNSDERPTAPDLTGKHGSHYSLATIAEAAGNSSAGAAQINGFSEHGGHYQVAVHSTAQAGFPVEGSSYLVVSAGDARNIGVGGYCGAGGVNIHLAVPGNAEKLSFEYRFWATDYLPYDDYFRAHLIAGSTATQIASSSISSEFGGGNGFRWSGSLRTISVDVTAYRGQTVTLRFEASNLHDCSYPAGAAIDNLRFFPVPPPPNRAPVITSIGGPYSGGEGQAIAFSADASDPDGQELTYTWTFGDGQSGTGPNPSHTYADNGAYEVALSVTDEIGVTTTATTTVTITNVAPTASVSAPSSLNEGTSIEFALTEATDPSPIDAAALKYAFDCGLGSGYGALGDASSVTCATTDNGTRTIKGLVRDKDGGSTEYSATVTISNVAPSATFSNNGPVNEGSPFSLSLSNPADPSSADVAAGFQYAFDCGTGYGAYGASATATCPTTDNGVRSVRGKLQDKDGAETEYAASVTIRNVAPSVNAGAGATIVSGESFTLAGSFSDPGADSPWSYEIAWGTGANSTGSKTATGAVSESRRYLAAGTYTVRLAVTDKDGGAGSDQTSVTVKRLPVSLDIKPGSSENPVNLKERGNLPVAILTTATFDARLVDVASVRLGPGGAQESHGRAHYEDVDRDGDLDLMLHFDVPAIGLTSSTTSLELLANLTDGRQIVGADTVRIVP